MYEHGVKTRISIPHTCGKEPSRMKRYSESAHLITEDKTETLEKIAADEKLHHADRIEALCDLANMAKDIESAKKYVSMIKKISKKV